MTDAILEMRNISKEFPGVLALDGVNFVVNRGEIHAICGENGAGKSTLMNILSGLFPYGNYSGDIFMNENECRFKSIKDSEKKGIAIVHQELALSPYLSIEENIFIGNEQTSMNGIIDWNITHIRAKEILQTVGLENEDLETPTYKLGVDKQQLIEIAKSLAKNAKILIFDEPTSALNDEESNKLLSLLLGLKAKGITVLLISHKIHELLKVGDTITILRDGKTIETLIRNSREFEESRIIKSMVGRTIIDRFPSRQHDHIGDVVFEIENWNVYHPDYENRKVIKNVNLNVRKGEVVGIAGLMGAGRTELAMSIFGRTYGQKITGTIRKNGKEIKITNVSQAIENGIAYLTEDRKVFGLVLINDVKWNLSLASLNQLAVHGIIDEVKEELNAEESIRKLNIKVSNLNQRVSTLSGGNQQKVVLSKWLLADPEILILDEPTRGIDVGAKYEFYLIINNLVKEGKSIILILSDMSELLGLSDRIYILNEGEVAGEIKREEFSQVQIMQTIIDHSGRRKVYG